MTVYYSIIYPMISNSLIERFNNDLTIFSFFYLFYHSIFD